MDHGTLRVSRPRALMAELPETGRTIFVYHKSDKTDFTAPYSLSNMRLRENEIRKKMVEGKIVSFDIFDTALRRKFLSSKDIFYVMESVEESQGRKTFPDFARNRIKAEAEAWKQTGSGQQITLKSIYQILVEKQGLEPEESIRLQNLELETERRFTYPDPRFLHLVGLAREIGLDVIFLSDMYLPSKGLRAILEAHGFPDPKVYTSGDEGGNKASGHLYQIVAQKMECLPSDFLHFGDNYYADYLRARLNGWRAIHVRKELESGSSSRASPKALSQKSQRLFVSAGRGLIDARKVKLRAKINSKFWEDFGYSVAGPIYFHFLNWLCQQAREDGINRLLLCSRDGFPLLRGLEILTKTWGINLDAVYFYASRRLFNLAGIDKIDDASLEFLLMPTPGLKLRDFIARLGLEPEAHVSLLVDLGFDSLDQQLVHDDYGRFLRTSYRRQLESWVRASQGEILARAEEERKLVLEYFAEISPGRSDTAVVDIGWKGTVCASLCRLLQATDSALRPQTYYFGTSPKAREILSAGGRLKSFFFHLGDPSQHQKIISGHEGIVEMLFHAPHGSLVGFKRTSQGMEPIFGVCEYDDQVLSHLEVMRTAAYCYIQDMADLFPAPQNGESSADEVGGILKRLSRQPTLEEARNLGQIPYRVSYGDQGPVAYLAKLPPKPDRNIMSDIKAYGATPWKEGYLAQVGVFRSVLLRITYLLRSLCVALRSGTLFASLRWALFQR